MNVINVMNDDYRVYYVNPFRRLWSVISSARHNLMKIESSAKERKLQADMQEMFEIKERYESDCKREKVLIGIIRMIEQQILDNEASISSDKQAHNEDEIARLKASLRRRTCELNRLRRQMADDLDRIERELKTGN